MSNNFNSSINKYEFFNNKFNNKFNKKLIK